jgi:hypothetical protein
VRDLARRLVPRTLRRALGAERARMRASRLERDLGALVSNGHTIVAGPWLGEVGFELLYWAPFLAWVAGRFHLAPERLVAVSRGGTRTWYAPVIGGYREIFDRLTPEEFRRRHDERVAINGEQKQNQVLAFEHDLLARLAGDIRPRAMLHPATMYRLFGPYWWGHVDETWVHRFARYRVLTAPAPPVDLVPAEPYTAVKFYFNDCFPPTEANRVFVARLLERLAARGPVVSLTTGLRLDDHGGCDVEALGVRLLPPGIDARQNLAWQTQIVAGARAFAGTYGGFSYLAPFHGVPAAGFYDQPDGFSRRHLAMAQSALGRAGGGRLAVHAARDVDAAAALVEELHA